MIQININMIEGFFLLHDELFDVVPFEATSEPIGIQSKDPCLPVHWFSKCLYFVFQVAPHISQLVVGGIFQLNGIFRRYTQHFASLPCISPVIDHFR